MSGYSAGLSFRGESELHEVELGATAPVFVSHREPVKIHDTHELTEKRAFDRRIGEVLSFLTLATGLLFMTSSVALIVLSAYLKSEQAYLKSTMLIQAYSWGNNISLPLVHTSKSFPALILLALFMMAAGVFYLTNTFEMLPSTFISWGYFKYLGLRVPVHSVSVIGIIMQIQLIIPLIFAGLDQADYSVAAPFCGITGIILLVQSMNVSHHHTRREANDRSTRSLRVTIAIFFYQLVAVLAISATNIFAIIISNIWFTHPVEEIGTFTGTYLIFCVLANLAFAAVAIYESLSSTIQIYAGEISRMLILLLATFMHVIFILVPLGRPVLLEYLKSV